MSEQELKLHVPRSSRTGVEKAMRRGTVSSVRLRAQYFDTPTSNLAKSGVALRLRLEGRRWVQTLKMPGAHRLEKLELNHPRPNASLDLSVYANTPAAGIIDKHGKQLAVAYETDVKRLYRKIRTTAGVVEVALDQGHIQAGELRLPVSEVEFELVSGRPHAMFLLGLKWLTAYNLILDLRSKAERGTTLAALASRLANLGEIDDAATTAARAKVVASYWAPRPIQTIKLNNQMTPAQALAAVTIECLDQIGRNAAVLAEIDTEGFYRASTPEHTHQLRVGIRRLRSAWSLFQKLTDLPPQPWRDELKIHFSALGTARDDDVLRETVMPELSAAGQPPLDLNARQEEEASTSITAKPEFQRWLAELLAWTVGAHPLQADLQPSPAHDPRKHKPAHVRDALGKQLFKWHQKVLADGLRFDALPIESKHDLRKLAKRLRYGLQFAESLLPAKKLKNYRQRLSRIQDILGEMNDLYVAREKFEGIREDQPSAWFAVGWIASRLSVLTKQAELAFKNLKRADHFWD
ncbi:CYTH and CHAD domain-containing protein [Orrella daihaiensis]|uniref:CYTH and CHAD domain-containing protein n=1 Tax=Orrella daihaiensis TaxID=2782176 RepID=A0ABY4AP28_9BURK|nr:CYTH and CHAD domain-containing protein [Orrella daihaiensis]UOD50800.1 CYTH and CHAD domain-containing protein [Orrella daihaiensis]